MKKDEFLERLTDEEMDKLLGDIDESKFEIDEITKKRIEGKVFERTKKKKRSNSWKFIGIAAAVLLAIGLFNPIVLAYMRGLFFVPNVGVVGQSESQMYMGKEIEIIEGKESLASAPIITSEENRSTLFLSVDSGPLFNRTKDIESAHFTLKINGEEVEGESYSSFGSSRIRHYKVYFPQRAVEGDKIEISVFSDIKFTGVMEELESVDIGSLASTKIYDSNIFAKPFKTDNGYEIYMFATSDEYKTETFNTTYPSRDKMYFLTSEGRKKAIIPPEGWGSEMMPSIRIEGYPGPGELVFEELVYSTSDTITYKYKLPRNKQTVEINEVINYGDTPITIEKIYWDELQESYAIDFSWNPNNNPKMYDPMGMLAKGVSYATYNYYEGTATIGLEKSNSFLGRGEFVLNNPQYIIEEEYKIPLNLE